MRFEILPSLPPYGPMAVSFTENGAREHREGLVVRFYPDQSDPWIGNFLGGTAECTVVLDHPNGCDVLIVAKGDACIIDPEHRSVRDRIAGDVTAVIPLPLLTSVVFQGVTDFTAIRADNSGWRSSRISWDGFRNIEVCKTESLGEAYTPIGDGWVPFCLNVLTGHCTDGIYQQDMARAVPVSLMRVGID